MGKSAPFGRPGASDRLRLWWHGTSKTSRTNALVFLVVGTISAGLVWAGVSGDAARTRGTATASRPQVSVPSSLATIPAALDLRAAGTGPAPSVVGDPASTTTTSPPGAVVVPTTPAPVRSATTATVPASPSPVTTAPNPQIVFTEVPVPTTAPEPTSPPTTSSSVPTTTPPATTRPAAAPSTTSPSTSSPPTTKGSTLPLPLDVPLLRPEGG